MRLGHVLFLSGINRNTYNTFKRRGLLPFMDQRLDSSSRGPFTDAHALAMTALMYLGKVGLQAPLATRAIQDSWRDICLIAAGDAGAAKSTLCGVRINDLGMDDTWGSPHPLSKGGDPIARSDVDLTQLWEIISAGIGELEYPAGVTDAE